MHFVKLALQTADNQIIQQQDNPAAGYNGREPAQKA
jgi:hypothetical protein